MLKTKTQENWQIPVGKLSYNGIIVMKKVFDKDLVTITTYDEKGNLLETTTEAKSNIVEAAIASPDEYERDFTAEQLDL